MQNELKSNLKNLAKSQNTTNKAENLLSFSKAIMKKMSSGQSDYYTWATFCDIHELQ